MNNNKFTYIKSENWEGLYVNGLLVFEDSRVDSQMLSKYTTELGSSPKVEWCSQNWIDGMGTLPERLDDVFFD